LPEQVEGGGVALTLHHLDLATGDVEVLVAGQRDVIGDARGAVSATTRGERREPIPSLAMTGNQTPTRPPRAP
jgi:hypothetical protein